LVPPHHFLTFLRFCSFSNGRAEPLLASYFLLPLRIDRYLSCRYPPFLSLPFFISFPFTFDLFCSPQQPSFAANLSPCLFEGSVSKVTWRFPRDFPFPVLPRTRLLTLLLGAFFFLCSCCLESIFTGGTQYFSSMENRVRSPPLRGFAKRTPYSFHSTAFILYHSFFFFFFSISGQTWLCSFNFAFGDDGSRSP